MVSLRVRGVLEEAAAETASLIQLIIPAMLTGMLTASIIFSSPQFRRLNDKIIVLSSFANLKSGIAIAAFFAHKVSGLSILADMYRRRLVDEIEVVIASVIGLFPIGIRSVVLLIAPVAISALGVKLGAIYSILDLASRFLVALAGIICGRRLLSGGTIEYENDLSVRNSVITTLIQFLRVSAVLIPTIFIVTLLLKLGFQSATFGDPAFLMIVVTGAGSTVAGLGLQDHCLPRV